MANDTVELIAFHDERYVSKWLYHGFILCEVANIHNLQKDLIIAKADAHCERDKRIHYSRLTSGSKSSSKTRTAKYWIEAFKRGLYGYIWFRLLGVNLGNIDYQFFGPATDGQERHFRIYNRFFEMGLFSACRYFFDISKTIVQINNIFSEERSLEKNNPFLQYAPHRINMRQSNVIVKDGQIRQIAGSMKKEKYYPDYVDIVNFTDVLTGAFSQILDCTSSQDGCIEVANKLYPLCRKLMEQPYNKNSRYYKRYATSFFPRSKSSKSLLANWGINPPEDEFYSRRRLRLFQPCFTGFEELII